jgi:hypothetical protein
MPTHDQPTVSRGSSAPRFEYLLLTADEEVPGPSSVDITSALLEVEDGMGVELHRSDESYLEALKFGDGYRVTFCEAEEDAGETYFNIDPEIAEYGVTNSILQEFAREESSWRTGHDWKKAEILGNLLLSLEDGSEIQGPLVGDISRAIKIVGEGRHSTFLILERSDGRFIQAAVNGDGYYVEYSEGKPGEQYALDDDAVSYQECEDLFLAFARGDEEWKTSKSWSPLN